MSGGQPGTSRPARQPFRLTAPHASEDDFHEAVARFLEIALLAPAQVTAFPAGGAILSPAAAARFFRLGLKTGWPDILIVYGGRVFGIELKAHGGSLSKTRTVHSKKTGRPRIIIGQETMHLWLKAAGMELAVCRSIEHVQWQLAAWNIPTRGITL